MHKSTLFTSLIQIWGLSIISWVLIRLLIIKRTPYQLNDTITFLQLLGIVLILIASFIEIKVLHDKLYHKENSSYIKKLFYKYLNKFYLQPLDLLKRDLVHTNIIKKFMAISNRFLLYFYNYNKTEYITIFITIYISFFARIILTIALMLDTFYLQQMFLFYKNIFLLIIPLTINCIFSLQQQHSTNILNNLEINDVKITYNSHSYNIILKNNNERGSVICKFHLSILDLLSFIHDIKQQYYFVHIQLIFAIISYFSSLSAIIIVANNLS